MFKNFIKRKYSFLLILSILSACIGQDIINDRVPEVLTISNPINTLKIGSNYQLMATYLNQVGIKETVNLVWMSSDPTIISINSTGLAQAIAIGNVDITAFLQGRSDIGDTIQVSTGKTTSGPKDITMRSGSLRSTSSYELSGDFVLRTTTSNLELELNQNFRASSRLPGLYVYLTNNTSTNNGALELGLITVFAGASTFPVPASVRLNDYSAVLFYCKPFSVKVGDGNFIN